MEYLFDTNIIFILLTFFTSLLITFLAIPIIINVAKLKNLFDEPDRRKSHKSSIPTLGGIAIFAGFVISTTLWSNPEVFPEIQYIIGAIVIVFFIGLKDDILIINPYKKLIGQIVAALIIIVWGGIRFTNLHGFLGIYEINYLLSLIITLFTIIVITNGFNLIDGIDGLSAGVGIVSATTFGICFFIMKEFQYVIFAAGLIASLIVFFRFNVFGIKNKIFMGDTGSLILGLLISILAIWFNELNIDSSIYHFYDSSPAISFGILIIPLFDTLRVFTIRVSEKHSPFKPDKNHLHHRLLTLGYSHLKSTIIILIINILFIIIVFKFQNLGIIPLMTIILILGAIYSYIPSLLIKQKRKELRMSNKSDN